MNLSILHDTSGEGPACARGHPCAQALGALGTCAGTPPQECLACARAVGAVDTARLSEWPATYAARCGVDQCALASLIDLRPTMRTVGRLDGCCVVNGGGGVVMQRGPCGGVQKPPALFAWGFLEAAIGTTPQIRAAAAATVRPPPRSGSSRVCAPACTNLLRTL